MPKKHSRSLAAALFVVLGISAAACSAGEEEKLPPGRCLSNIDCPSGQACRDRFCEDIYYPEHKIKPY